MNSADEDLSETVVMQLLEPVMGKGGSVTVNNACVSISVASKLIAMTARLLGTMSKR